MTPSVNFAADSRRANPWAADLYRRARARGHDTLTPHASWPRLALCDLALLAWQTNTAYDPSKHRALQAGLKRDEQPAA